MTEQQKRDNEDIDVLPTRVKDTKKAAEGSPSAYDTVGGASLRPGKPKDDDA